MEIKYRVVTYYTFRGLVKSVHLGDFVYGEWIVYQDEEARYHINVFKQRANSDLIINDLLLNNKNETIKTIIDKINKNHGLKLSLNNRPFIRLRLRSETADLNLPPIPDHFVKNL
ncbi:hypothetical protein LX99_01362 [Mucilaginibacter oryzae]|uniref:Uncharacterized protein n=1 Tax=Mucilaginibacter oryzae TaxID=468058 RepID=A0A316HCH5_9SPHI|nr:hypothetical protein LX99_01362 [Mucilaginibacter oryzae]